MRYKLKWIILLLLLLLTIMAAYQMYALAARQALWGYWPLLFITTLWGCVVCWWFRRAEQDRLLGWATLSGTLATFGFPGWLPLPLLMAVAFVPLLYVEQQIANAHSRPRRGLVFKYSFHAFVLWNIGSGWWIANASIAAGMFAIFANAALMSLPVVLYHQTRCVMPRLGFAPLIAYWMSFEYLHFHWELNYPWLTLGNSLAQLPALAQWYEYTGVFGGTLWIWLLNITAFSLCRQPSRSTRLQFGICLLAPIALSLVLYAIRQDVGRPVRVVLVQPNYEPHYEEPATTEANRLEHYWQLARLLLDDSTDYLVLPEAALEHANTRELDAAPSIVRLRELTKPYPNLKVISGLMAYHVLAEDEPRTTATRVSTTRSGNTIAYEVLNAAVQFSNNSPDMPLHRKSKLVPGPEHFPFKKWLFFVEPIMDRLGGTTAGLGTQPRPSIFQSAVGRIGPLICYESVFGEYVSSSVRQGAEAFFVMTNDGWWDHTTGHRQHLFFASLRAIENRRSVARAANTGITAVINQRGDILQATRYNEATAIRATLLLNNQPTFYTRWGDMLARLSLFATALFLLNTFVRSITLQKP